MELVEQGIDVLSLLSLIELEATSGDEMEAYLFQEGEGSMIFQAGGEEHRRWKLKFEESCKGASGHSPGSSSYCSSGVCEKGSSCCHNLSNCYSTFELCGVMASGLSLTEYWPSPDSVDLEFPDFSGDNSPGGAFCKLHMYPEARKLTSVETDDGAQFATVEKSPSFFHSEIASILAAQIKMAELHSQQPSQSFKHSVSCDDLGFRSRIVTEGRPIQAIEISLRRWIDFLENHTIRASYEEIVQISSSAERFTKRVEFFLFTLVDILIRSSRTFKIVNIHPDEGVLFPPLSTLSVSGHSSTTEEGESNSRSSSASSSHRRNRARDNKSEMQRLQEWLIDGIDYLENQEIEAYYDDYQMLHATAKELVEILESYFRNIVDQVLQNVG